MAPTLSKNVAISGAGLRLTKTPLRRPHQSRRLIVPKAQDTFDPKTGVRCFVNSDGHLVCEKLAPGDYVVKQTSPQPHEDGAPGITYCHVTEEGELICEGLEEGEYTVDTATPKDIEELLEKAPKQ